MPTDATRPDRVATCPGEPTPVDFGLLSPVTLGAGSAVDDATVARCLVAAEVALTRAWAERGVAPAAAAREISDAFGWQASEPLSVSGLSGVELGALVTGATAGGNPVIPLVGLLRGRVSAEARPWLHAGATSQDILDSALMLLARDAGEAMRERLLSVEARLGELALAHSGRPAAARTLTQHAVPTTFGLRFANWRHGVARVLLRLGNVLDELPAQLGGAGGTLASFVAIGGESRAAALPGEYARQLGLAAPTAPWHTTRWPVTELGDVLVQVTDALGVIAADVATLSRTEIGELVEGAAGGSSAMPQKRNPVRAVLVRSAAIRAPHLSATLHTAAALAVDERPDGAWHAEWPTLRELLRLALGAVENTDVMLAGLGVDAEAVARNLGQTGGLIVAERLAIELGPVLGADRVREIIGGVNSGDELAAALAAVLATEPALEGIDVSGLLDAAKYLGLAEKLARETGLSDTSEDAREPKEQS